MKFAIAIATVLAIIGLVTFTFGLMAALSNENATDAQFPDNMAGKMWTLTLPYPIPEGYRITGKDLNPPRDWPVDTHPIAPYPYPAYPGDNGHYHWDDDEWLWHPQDDCREKIDLGFSPRRQME